MAKYRRYIATGLIILVVPSAMVIRSLSNNHFRTDADKLAAPSYNHSVVITPEQVNSIAGSKLLISFEEAGTVSDALINGGQDIEEISTDAASLLSKENRKKIMKHKGSVFIVSGDPALSSGVWMILSQMGRKDIFVVTDNEEPGVFKHEFRPDTIALPEF